LPKNQPATHWLDAFYLSANSQSWLMNECITLIAGARGQEIPVERPRRLIHQEAKKASAPSSGSEVSIFDADLGGF
jgi:hypothetical protein